MAPAFSTLNLQKSTLGVLRSKTIDYIQKLRAVADSENSSVDMKELNVSVIFEILTESLFDLRVDDVVDGFDCNAFIAAQNSFLKESVMRNLIPFRHVMFWSKEKQFAVQSESVLKNLGATVLRKYREEHDGKKDDGSSIIGHLIANDYPSEEHRISDLIVFLIAGHETTAHSLSFFLYCMAKNEDARAKLQRELDAHLPMLSAHPTATELESISPSAIAQLEYFSWCLKESQRLYPVAPVVGRQLQRELTHNGFVLPKNSSVFVHMYCAGRQRWIEDAEQFKPERWSKAHPQYEQLKQIPSVFSM
jgi:cytochrome P450